MNRFLKSCALILLFSMIGACGGAKRAKRVEEAQLRLQLGQNLLAKGELTQGTVELVSASELDPQNAEIRNMLALAYFQTNRPEKAEEELRKAIAFDPKFSDAHNHLCAYLIQKTKYDEAIEHCTKAVENVSYPTPERAYHNMGLAYQGKGNAVKAIESFRNALIHNPNFVMSRKSLGMLLLDQKRTKEGVSQLEGASSVCGAAPKGVWGQECPETYYQLAMTYVKMKQRTKAVATLKKCIDSDDQGAYGEKCRESLKILE